MKFLTVSAAIVNQTSVLKDVVTAEMMNGVLDEVIGVLPVCIPVMISFISLRKGISFVMGVLRSA